jgi:purine-nucleoside phosphorylase
MSYSKADYELAVAAIKSKLVLQPKIGLVLGSGLGGLAESIENPVTIAYADIPGWPKSTVIGHSGQLVIGKLEGQAVIAQQGRAHFYEGYDLQQVTFPIRIMHLLGVETVILTNAAGSLHTDWQVGDLMLISDHINFVGMAGHNPLVGPNDDAIGPRFLGMVQTYDRTLRQLTHQVAQSENITLRDGVYVCLAGPNFETPAEIRMLRTMGGDAVGMSTAHEVLVARHAGMRVLAFSGLTNICIDDVDAPVETNHEEVLDAGAVLVPRLTALLRGVLRAILL